jgi:murein DD-endopeptidase MepM/ murein hydrolase activator NlpD
VADSLLAQLSSRTIGYRKRLLGSGGKRYLQTRGWKSSRFRGDLLLVLSHSPRGWQWSGIALVHPTEEWIARWQPVELATNQPLPFPIKAPWPAGQSFMAGGLVDFSLKMGLVAAAGFFGGPILAYAFSRNDCGFGPRGFYYNSVFSHNGNDAFAIDFTRYKYGRPFTNISEGTPVLAAARGWVWDVEASIPSGDDSGTPNEVDIMHVDPATQTDRFVARYLHLAGPWQVLVNKFAPVEVGNRLGVMDDTGVSRLHHLHFSIHDQQLPHPMNKFGPSIRPSPMDGRTLGDGDSGACIRSTNVETKPPMLLDDVANPTLFESQHFVHTETADRLHLWTLTGVVLLHLKGTGRDWLRAQVNLGITVPEIPPGAALRLVHWAPFVTINAIQNDDTSNWAGWAVDRFGIVDPGTPITRQVTVQTDVAVRDTDGYLLRLGYEVTLAGSFTDRPLEPEGPVIL